MCLSLWETKMVWINRIIPPLMVFLIQFLLVDFLSINLIRPDFIVIYVFYFSLRFGRAPGIIMGFTIGLLSDLTGVGSQFGLGPLTLSITAYLTGYLNGKYERLLPYVFHLFWIGIIGFHFFMMTYVRFQTVMVSDWVEFGMKWLLSFGYTMIFFFIIQFFYPVREASRAEIR